MRNCWVTRPTWLAMWLSPFLFVEYNLLNSDHTGNYCCWPLPLALRYHGQESEPRELLEQASRCQVSSYSSIRSSTWFLICLIFLFSLDGSRLWNKGLRGSQSRMVFNKCCTHKSGCDGGWLISNVPCNTYCLILKNVVCTVTGWDRLTSSFSVLSFESGWIRIEDP